MAGAVDAARAAPPDPNGSGVYRSDDGGKTWTFMSNQNQRPMYFSQIRVDPVNDQKIFVGGNPGADVAGRRQDVDARHTARTPITTPSGSIPRIRASSRSATTAASTSATTAASPGISTTIWRWASSIRFRPICAGPTGSAAACRTTTPGAARARCAPSTGPVNTDWFTVAGGDGFYTRQDPTDWAIVYGESQDGAMSGTTCATGTQKSIRPTVRPGAVERWRRGGDRARTLRRQPGARGSGTRDGGAGLPPARQPRRGSAAGLRRTRRHAQRRQRAGPTSTRCASTGTRPSRSRRTIRPSSTWRRSIFFKSTNRGDTWWMNPTDLSKNVNRWAPEMSIMGVSGEKPMAEKHDGYAASSLPRRSASLPRSPASSGSAPTTATCR